MYIHKQNVYSNVHYDGAFTHGFTFTSFCILDKQLRTLSAVVRRFVGKRIEQLRCSARFLHWFPRIGFADSETNYPEEFSTL